MIGEQVFDRYHQLGLVPILEHIRQPDRYASRNGVNVLTNTVLCPDFDEGLVLQELNNAQAAKVPGSSFTSLLEPTGHGLSYGLNPYTDWAVRHIPDGTDRWVLIVGLDYYSISGLEPSWWPQVMRDPFAVYDHFWCQVWRWILGSIRTDHPQHSQFASQSPDSGLRDAAAAHLQSCGYGILFHNIIPYLRPPDVVSSADKEGWEDKETAKKQLMADCYDDILKFNELTRGHLKVYCTRNSIKDQLTKPGRLAADQVVSWGSHPSSGKFVGWARANAISPG